MDIIVKRESPEWARLSENNGQVPPWYRWGPYVSERSWGTVREDYSLNGDAWKYLTHDMARLKTYRWGEDGIAGICDRYQLLAITFAFWNGKDPFLKERLFGLGPHRANHGEDVKELYYYLDCTPTHSYMKYLYKYPHNEFPYDKIIHENAHRFKKDREYELVDTGIFDENRYFDIEIEIAKASPEDIAIRITATNRGPDSAPLHLIPQMMFRKRVFSVERRNKVRMESTIVQDGNALLADDTNSPEVGALNFSYHVNQRYLYGPDGAEMLFTNNESNRKRLMGKPDESSYLKDAFHRYIVEGEKGVVNDLKRGTKACLHYTQNIEAGKSWVLDLRFSDQKLENPLQDVESIVTKRKEEADWFYREVSPENASDEERWIQKMALGGMLWSKQFYHFDVSRWLRGDDEDDNRTKQRKELRNKHWSHLVSMRVLSMPDKWEYPWFAAWDLAFHCLPLALVDFDFAKEQLWLLLFDQFQHPNGQIPAYEWEFSELNPPVQAWAVLKLYEIGQKKHGVRDTEFLKRCFHKLVMNFVWWVNKVDEKGNNVFEGGFLGLDNITIIDRSQGVPGGGKLEQSDGTGWMALFCLSMMRMALELAEEDSEYELMAIKFFEHFVYIAAALHESENRTVQIWDDKDGFFYDVLSYPNGRNEQIKVRSLVGIIPLFAIDAITDETLEKLPTFASSFRWFLEMRKGLVSRCVTPIEKDGKRFWLLAPMNTEQMHRVLTRVWDPNEFRSPYGLRSLSKVYEKNPYTLLGNTITYEPGEAVAVLKGGNSNWRGPIWFPTSYIFIESLKKIHRFLGDDYKVAAPGEDAVSAHEMGEYFAGRMIALFTKDENNSRPFHGDCERLQKDPEFRDLLLFYEHFHGETGRGLGASHQTGWTGLIATLIDEWR